MILKENDKQIKVVTPPPVVEPPKYSTVAGQSTEKKTKNSKNRIDG